MDKRGAKVDGKKSAPPKNETQNLSRSLPSPWSTSTQAYHNVEHAATSNVNPATSLFYPSWSGSQMPTAYDAMYQSWSFSNIYPMAAAEVGQCCLLDSGDEMQRISCDKSLQPSIPKTNGEGLPRSVTSESKETTVVGHDVKNAGAATTFKIKNAYNLWSFQLQDIPSTRQGQSSMMQGNGPASQNVSSNETCNVIASDHFEANPTELQNQKLGTEPDACGSKPQLKRKETAEEKEQRRKHQKKIASKRSRMKIKIEREKIIDSLESLDDENAVLREELHARTIECERIEKENNALLAELIEQYGEETVMNLLKAQSTDSVAGGGQGSNS
ncbi:G-box-binding factor 1 [Glycine soja]